MTFFLPYISVGHCHFKCSKGDSLWSPDSEPKAWVNAPAQGMFGEGRKPREQQQVFQIFGPWFLGVGQLEEKEQKQTQRSTHAVIPFIQCSEAWETGLWWTKSEQWFPLGMGGLTEGTGGNLGSDGKVRLDTEIGYTGICICQNSLNCSLKLCAARCMQITLIKTNLRLRIWQLGTTEADCTRAEWFHPQRSQHWVLYIKLTLAVIFFKFS